MFIFVGFAKQRSIEFLKCPKWHFDKGKRRPLCLIASTLDDYGWVVRYCSYEKNSLEQFCLKISVLSMQFNYIFCIGHWLTVSLI